MPTKIEDVRQRIAAADLLIEEAKEELKAKIGGVLVVADSEAYRDELRIGDDLFFERADMQALADFMADMFGIRAKEGRDAK